jgi:hypothetical protein
MKYIICDLDGTLALCEHRLHFLRQEPPDWDSFFLAAKSDEPNHAVIDIVNALWEYGDYKIVIFSGRSDIAGDITAKWLTKHGVCYDAIRMRKQGDYTPDNELKQQWLEELGVENVYFCIDDRQKVVDMWRSQGLTCLQVAEGNF